ncbi:biotin--[acetyl-CoA-carboxylase] ligase [Streptomyces sp. B1866]|uniref:biotin--[acetyl-CoA-carboxylase] ligase n=1 Tax=Streptomyces sp. B1866 TaxID=3075431 RepID=UPI002890C1A6|nr:biotin--[acetyl-CoA-carboxylase] ligase [Streptomyces sp. B1866]MDT3400167.1 biotin--[acetyl-CoA-carboxylase] ligase [Streptomyces sp. B1866]
MTPSDTSPGTPEGPDDARDPADPSGHARAFGTPGGPGRWADLERPPLSAAALRRALVRPGGLWSELDVVAETGSTNTDLAVRARAGAPEGAVLVAERQTAGRGRLGRTWSAPARSGLFFSVLLRPGEGGARVPSERWGWLPLLVGVASAGALARTAGVDTALKWPNDVLVTVDGEERKFGGILAERVDGAVVVGVGLNVSLRADELPVPTAGSLALAGSPATDRDPLLRAVLRSIEEWYGEWRRFDGDPEPCGLHAAYAAGCATLGRRVRAELPGGEERVGEAVAVDGDGRLVLATEGGVQEPVGAGDIVHLRPAS